MVDKRLECMTQNELSQAHKANRFPIYKKESDLANHIFFKIDMFEEILTLVCDGFSFHEIQSLTQHDNKLQYYFDNCGFYKDACWAKPNRYPKSGAINRFIRLHFVDEYKEALSCAIETLESQLTDFQELKNKAERDDRGKLDSSSIQLIRVWADNCKNKINNYRRLISSLEIKEDNGIEIKIIRYGDTDAD